MTPYVARFLLFCIALTGSGVSTAQAITTIELQRLLQSAPLGDVRFQEQRQSPWLAAPMASRGIVRLLPQGLEKQVESPKQETWRLLPDRLEWRGPDGAGNKQILFSQAPALAVLSNAMRRVVAGDLQALERDFRITPQGDAKMWTVHLEPQTTEVARHLDHLEMQGTGSHLLVLTVVERKGERTTTRFYP
jgi:Outer membrane lipoprotein carrier protein LolA-like